MTVSDRAKNLMDDIWKSRNSGADTEQKLVAQILKLFLNYVTLYETENKMIMLSTDDIANLSNELETLE